MFAVVLAGLGKLTKNKPLIDTTLIVLAIILLVSIMYLAVEKIKLAK